MKRSNNVARRSVSAVFAVLVLMLAAASAFAQTTAFTYQGRLSDGAAEASGSFDLQFRLFDTPTPGTGTQTGATIVFSAATGNAISVSNGVFTVTLDFGANPFQANANRYLEIGVKRANEANYTILNPRQQLTSAPFSIQSLAARTSDGLSANCVACVTDANIASVGGAKVTGTVASATTAATAGNVTGIVGIANGGTGSATKNFVDLTTDQTIGGNKTFTGVLSGDASGLRNISGTNVTGSTALNPQRLAILRWYDVNRATIARPIAVGLRPAALAFDGTFIYTANEVGNSVTRIRAATGEVEGGAIAVGRTPLALAFDGTFVYVANDDSNDVTRIRAATGTVEGSSIAVGTGPLALTFDGTFVYVANDGSNDVTRIRAATGAVEGGTIAVGTGPRALAFDGTFVYVANDDSDTITRIRAATGAVEGSPIAVGSGPRALAFDGTFVYVANLFSNNVMRF